MKTTMLRESLEEWCSRPGNSQKMAAQLIGYSQSSISAFLLTEKGSMDFLHAVRTFLLNQKQMTKKQQLKMLFQKRVRLLKELVRLEADIEKLI